MSIVRLVDVHRYYGDRHLFGPVTATIEAGDRIGFIGPNGSGKTTMLRLIAGIDQPNGGTVFGAARARRGYMTQETAFDDQATPYSFVMEALEHITRLASEMRSLEQAMATETNPDQLTALMEKYAAVSERYEREGGYEADSQVRSHLFGLGLREEHLHQPAHTLSGGEQARVALARLLVTQPDLLILDEPTNHLDVRATEWLEEACRNYPGAILVVSHDRYFLDAITNRIWELDETGNFATYRGNYSAAGAQREAERERRLKEYEAQQEEIERLEAYVRKYKAGNRATMAKSRERRLERMERVERPGDEPGSMKLRLSYGMRGSREVVRLEEVGHSYGSHQVLSGVTTLIERGQRVGILGPNGSGKSTLLSIIAGRLKPTQGAAYMGRDIEVGFYAQQTEEFGEGNTILDELLTARHMTTPEARSYLARFLFRGEDVFKSVAALSGGEKRRLMLAKLLLSSTNLLCLDEPTNHLDIPARETLEEALMDFEGTLLFISHDRYFLSRLATRLIIVGEAGTVEHFAGGYEEYQQWRKRSEAQANEAQERTKRRSKPQGESKKQEPRPDRQLKEVESLIERLEEEKEELERLLADASLYTDAEKARETTVRHRNLEEELTKAYETWDELVSLVSDEQ